MKKRKLFLALGLSFTFAFGLGATLSLDRDVQAVQADQAPPDPALFPAQLRHPALRERC